jgi:hypothetical protein
MVPSEPVKGDFQEDAHRIGGNTPVTPKTYSKTIYRQRGAPLVDSLPFPFVFMI